MTVDEFISHNSGLVNLTEGRPISDTLEHALARFLVVFERFKRKVPEQHWNYFEKKWKGRRGDRQLQKSYLSEI